MRFNVKHCACGDLKKNIGHVHQITPSKYEQAKYLILNTIVKLKLL